MHATSATPRGPAFALLLAAAAAAAIVATGCKPRSSSRCGERICPPSAVCAAQTSECVLPEQVAACEGLAADAPCTFQKLSGVCRAGFCHVVRCGDGRREPPEACDDGNDISGDGCSSDCLSDETCGNGRVDRVAGEECDCGKDGALAANCKEPNGSQPSATCRADCQLPHCGDGVIAGRETCEGADLGGKRCVDVGFYGGELRCNAQCSYDRSGCVDSCGDGIINGPELCDGDDSLQQQCTDLGYGAGRLQCAASCSYNFATCRAIGWPAVNLAASTRAVALWFASTTEGYAATSSGLLRFDGRDWHAVAAAPAGVYTDVWGSGVANTLVLYGSRDDGSLVRFDAAMASAGFKTIATGESVPVNAIFGVSKDLLYAVRGAQDDSGFDVLSYDGQNVSKLMSFSGSGYDVWAASKDALYVGASGGRVMVRSVSGWRTDQVGGNAVRFRGLWGSSASDVFAVSDAVGGRIYRYNGSSWLRAGVGINGLWRSVWGSSASDVYVAGTRDIAHYDGSHWRALQGGEGTAIAGFTSPGAVRATLVYATSETGAIRRFSGSAWSALPALSGPGLRALLAFDSDDVLVVGSSGGVDLVQRHGAGGWTPQTLPSSAQGKVSQGLWAAAPDDVFAVGGSGVARFDGSTWRSEHALGSTQLLFGVWGSAANNVVAVGRQGAPARGLALHYDGSSWREIALPASTPTLVAVWGSSPSAIYAVGSGGAIVRFDGSSWSSMASSTGENLSDVWGAARDDVFAVGNSGTIVRFDGATWAPMLSHAQVDLTAVVGLAADDVFVVGRGVAFGEIVHYDGVRWSQVRSPSSARYVDIAAAADALLLLASDGTVDRLLRVRPW